MAYILVVDDEPEVVEIVQFRLERDGHIVTSASDGEEGLEAVLTEHPDLVLLDVMMPQMDGFEVLRRLKSDAQTVDTPVVMLTAKADLASSKKGWDLDVDNYITKPFNLDDLADTVRNVLISRRPSPMRV